MTVAYLLKHDKFGSNFVLIKQNLPNSIILPPKNGGFKARSHSVRKANSSVFMTKFNMMYVLFYIQVFIKRGNDIRNKLFGSPRFLTRGNLILKYMYTF